MKKPRTKDIAEAKNKELSAERDKWHPMDRAMIEAAMKQAAESDRE